jgi:hypothetical protein
MAGWYLLSSSGGGIYLNESNPIISYNLIASNFVSEFGSGGGIQFGASSCPMIFNNTIVGNHARPGSGSGIAGGNPDAVIMNNISWNNDWHEIVGNLTVVYCNVEGGWPGEGNIDLDPLFCYSDTGNYFLSNASPCVGSGQSGEDMGAYGIGCESACGDANWDGAATPEDAYLILNCLGSGPLPVSCWASNVNGDAMVTPSDGFYLLDYFGVGLELNCQHCTFTVIDSREKEVE